MAGLTTSSLASLREPEEHLASYTPVRRRPALLDRLGLAPWVSRRNLTGLLSTALLSVAWLVALNSLQAFVLTDILDVPASRVGTTSGTLIMLDELLALVMVLVWGAVIDSQIGPRFVAAFGHFVVAVAFFLYPRARTAFPGLLFCRLLFSVGASALVTILSAVLSRYSDADSAKYDACSSDDSPVDERTSLLPPDTDHPRPGRASNANASGLLGFTTGCGALLAVFVFLRLPVIFSHESQREPTGQGLVWTFDLLALLALLESFFLLLALRERREDDGQTDSPEHSIGQHVRKALLELPVGFNLAFKYREIALACYAAFTTRAMAVIVTAMIPIYIQKYFREHDLCQAVEQLVPSGCRRAVVLSSSLTGVVQLVSLLSAPVLGWASARFTDFKTLSICSLVGAVSFLAFGLVPRGDPRTPLVWIAGIGMGVAQIAGIVISLSIVAQARARVLATDKVERAGSIAGVYSMAGGLGILITGQLGGALLDVWTGSPFVLIAALQLILCVASYAVSRHGKAE